MSDQPAAIYVIGSLNADLVQSVPRLPRLGETITGGDLKMFTGGKGANQAYAAARMGACVSMIGEVGSDSLGTQLIESLQSAGVDTTHVGVSQGATGAATIFVLPNGENSIVVSPGANAELSVEKVSARLGAMNPGSYALLQLEIPTATVAESLTLAKGRGATTILDPAPAQRFDPDLLRDVDFLTPNETEALHILERGADKIENEMDTRDVAERIRALGVSTVVLTLGSRGCYVLGCAAGAGGRAIAGYEVDAVDTTAAGDTFNGAFACKLAEGSDAIEAARFANAAAAISVTRPGAQNSVPTRAEVDAFLIRMDARPAQ